MEQGIDELIKAMIPEALNQLPKHNNGFNFINNLRKEDMEQEIDEMIETLVSIIWINLNKIDDINDILLGGDPGKEEMQKKIGKIIEASIHKALSKLSKREDR